MQKLVVLGTGFGAFSLIKSLKRSAYDVTVVSPRNYFLFTPLLPSTTVGTTEFRSIIEPIRRYSAVRFYQAYASSIDTSKHMIQCRHSIDGTEFTIPYDEVVISVGAVNNTFGIQGVQDNALFLKELWDSRRIRQLIIDRFEQAATPSINEAERARLLHFVVVGGGPTGVEFAAELADFVHGELQRAYPTLTSRTLITLIEAGSSLLSSFDQKLSDYARTHFSRLDVNVIINRRVKQVSAKSLLLDDGSQLLYGVLVWSTGNGPTDFVRDLQWTKDRTGRLMVDSYLRVIGQDHVYAIGDCSALQDHNTPATAQVAMQQGKYLGKSFNRRARSKQAEPFRYRHLGMLAYIGRHQALADLPQAKSRGFTTWLFWRSAYLTRLVSLKNKAMVLFDWFKGWVFGRDISRF